MHFEKVSYEQWVKDVPLLNVPPTVLKQWHNSIILPKQGTMHSMGVDFFAPYNIKILPHNKVKIPTGIRWVDDDKSDAPYETKYGMMIVPRSSIGIKYGLRLQNTIGIIDADYYEAENEGHIILFFENTTDNEVILNGGQGIAQGIITNYYVPYDAQSEVQRVGGFGSTDK